MIGFYHAVLGNNRGTLHYGKNISLHTLSGYVRTIPGFCTRDLIQLIQEDDPVLLCDAYGIFYDFIHIDKTLRFLLEEDLNRFWNLHPSLFLLCGKEIPENLFHIEFHLFQACTGEDFNHGNISVRDLQFHVAGIQLPISQHSSQFITG